MAVLRIYFQGVLQQQIELTAEQTRIGRAADNDVVIDDPSVSSHHAEILREGNGYRLRDRGSTNGLYVNGKLVAEKDLDYWDEIRIGEHLLTFMAVKRPPGEAAAEHGQEVRAEAHPGVTTEIDLAAVAALAELKRAKKDTYIELKESGGHPKRHRLDRVIFRIGKARENNICLPGWFTPRIAAEIQRQGDGFYLVPFSRGQVTLNGKRLSSQTRLSDQDEISVRGLAFTFYQRPQPQP